MHIHLRLTIIYSQIINKIYNISNLWWNIFEIDSYYSNVVLKQYEIYESIMICLTNYDKNQQNYVNYCLYKPTVPYACWSLLLNLVYFKINNGNFLEVANVSDLFSFARNIFNCLDNTCFYSLLSTVLYFLGPQAVRYWPMTGWS